jgi:hypothetical protein
LKRDDHPEVAAAVERGEYRSTRQAALAAGIVKPPDVYKQLRGGVEAYAPEVVPGVTRY